MVTKKRKPKNQKQRAARPEANAIPAPLPHSRIDYSKFDGIEDVSDGEEDPPLWPCPGDMDPPKPDCNCATCNAGREKFEQALAQEMRAKGKDAKEKDAAAAAKGSASAFAFDAALQQAWQASGKKNGTEPVTKGNKMGGKAPMEAGKQSSPGQKPVTSTAPSDELEDEMPDLVSDEEDYDYDPSDHNSYTTAEGSSDEEDISYIAKGPSPSQNASAQNASSQNASSQNAKTNGQTPPKPGHQPKQAKEALPFNFPEFGNDMKRMAELSMAEIYQTIIDSSAERARMGTPSPSPLHESIDDSLRNMNNAVRQPWPGVQSQEDPVQKYKYSVMCNSFPQKVAEELNRLPAAAIPGPGGVPWPSATMQMNGSNGSKQGREKAPSRPAASKSAKPAPKTAVYSQTSENVPLPRTILDPTDLKHANEVAEKNFKALLEEEAKQKEEERKRQAERDEAKRNRRKQKQQRKKERAGGQSSNADPEPESSQAAKRETAAEEEAGEVLASSQASPAAEAAGVDQQEAEKAARKRKVKGRDQPAAEDSQIAASTKKTNKKQEANALGKAPSSSKKVGTQLAEADSAKLSSDSSASLEEPAASSGAADQDEAEEDSSNPFSLLQSSQTTASPSQPAGTGKARGLESMFTKLNLTGQPRQKEEAGAEPRRPQLKQQWQRQPFPSPSGYAPAPTVAQAELVWRQLEDTIDGDNVPLSNSVVQAERWLSAQAKSKVFNLSNAELKVRIQQARHILKQNGVNEPAALVRPGPASGTAQKNVPHRPTPQQYGRGQMGGRGMGFPRPYMPGRGRGAPPAAFMAPSHGQSPQQWEPTSVADLDAFGGVPNRANMSNSPQPPHPSPPHVHPRAPSDVPVPIYAPAQPSLPREPRFPGSAMGRGARSVPPRAFSRPGPPAASLNAATPPTAAAASHPSPVKYEPTSTPTYAQPSVAPEASRHHFEEEETLCCICLEWPPEIILQPCGHNNMCEKCAHNVKNLNEGLCPECRCKIEEIIKPR